MLKYDVILQNNATKETILYTGLEDSSENHLYHIFDLNLDLPEGEYTYAALLNMRDDVSYAFKVPLIDSLVHTEDGDTILKYLQPLTGLIRIGDDVVTANIYDDIAPESGGTNNNNNEIFYYE